MLVTARRCLAAGVPSAVGTAQSTFVVPGTHPTIQAAIAAAVNGDTALVMPGTYFERINFVGKAIIVQSTAGAAATTIDGNFGGPPSCTCRSALCGSRPCRAESAPPASLSLRCGLSASPASRCGPRPISPAADNTLFAATAARDLIL